MSGTRCRGKDATRSSKILSHFYEFKFCRTLFWNAARFLCNKYSKVGREGRGENLSLIFLWNLKKKKKRFLRYCFHFFFFSLSHLFRMEYKLTPLIYNLKYVVILIICLVLTSESMRNDGWLRHAVITPKCVELLIIIMIERCNVIYEEMDYMLVFCRLLSMHIVVSFLLNILHILFEKLPCFKQGNNLNRLKF